MDTETMCKHHQAEVAAARRRLRLCLAASIALLLLLAAAAAVLFLTVLRPRPAVTTVTSVRLAGINTGLSAVSALDVNVTLALALAIRNPNAAAFTHRVGRAEVYYRGVLAGEAAVPAGHIDAGGEEAATVYLTVLAGRLAGYAAQLYSDVVSAGVVPLTVRTAVPGTVSVLGGLRHRMVMYATCEVAVSVQRQGAQSSQCRYAAKF